MLATPQNYEDVNKYYKGTWVKFKEEGDTLFYIERATPSRIECHTISKEECCIDLTKPGGYFLEFLIPRKTVYQYDNCAVMLGRNPARMWKKGMCNSNTSFSILKEKGWTGADFSVTLAEGFVNKPSYLSVPQALEHFKVAESNFSAALTPRISMTRGGSVYIDDIVVAKYHATNNTLAVRKIYVPELQEVFKTSEMKVLA